MATMISWKGTHNEDWPAWAGFHREGGAYEASRGRRGRRAVAAKHQEIAPEVRPSGGARAEKKAAKAAAP